MGPVLPRPRTIWAVTPEFSVWPWRALSSSTSPVMPTDGSALAEYRSRGVHNHDGVLTLWPGAEPQDDEVTGQGGKVGTPMSWSSSRQGSAPSCSARAT
jgi:hypothetical protein